MSLACSKACNSTIDPDEIEEERSFDEDEAFQDKTRDFILAKDTKIVFKLLRDSRARRLLGSRCAIPPTRFINLRVITPYYPPSVCGIVRSLFHQCESSSVCTCWLSSTRRDRMDCMR